jgi:hypothetical protein
MNTRVARFIACATLAVVTLAFTGLALAGFPRP